MKCLIIVMTRSHKNNLATLVDVILLLYISQFEDATIEKFPKGRAGGGANWFLM